MTRYYAALIAGLRDRGWQVEVPLVSSGCDFHTRLSRLTQPLRAIFYGARVLDKLSNLLFRRKVRQGRFDLLLVTDPNFGRDWLEARPDQSDARFVIVVHDTMSCVVAPDGLYDSAGPALVNLLYLTRQAHRVICISEDTRRALLSLAPLSQDRVSFIHTGNLLVASAPIPSSITLPARFLLFVGERSGRKGFYQFARAFAAIRDRHPDIVIVCTGVLNPAEVDLLERLQVAASVQAIPADDATLAAMYRNAACLVYPSLYEGFGLPAIEAMHYGCPVITTNCGALPEICQDAAVIVDPDHPEELSAAIDRMLTDPEFAADYRRRGIARASVFSTATMMDRFHQTLKLALAPAEGPSSPAEEPGFHPR